MTAAVLRWIVGTLWRPRATFAELEREGKARTGAALVALSGACWAALTAALHAHGHAPSVTLVPIARSDYYLWQTGFVVPLLLVLWLLLTGIVHLLCRRAGAQPRLRPALAVLGAAYAVPLLFFFIVPDVFIYAALGFDALRQSVRWYAPVTPLVTLVLTTLALTQLYRVGTVRAFAAALVALTAQAAVGGVLLR